MGTAMQMPRTLTLADLEQCGIWEEVGAAGGLYDGRIRARPDLVVASDPESVTGVFIVASDFTLADSSVLRGYSTTTPATLAALRGWFGGIGLLQPAIVLERGQVRFWFAEEPERPELLALYQLLERDADDVFPLEVNTRIELPPDQLTSARLNGFCFPRPTGFSTPFPALNRTLFGERLGYVR